MIDLAQSEEKLAAVTAAPPPKGTTFWSGSWGLYTGRALVLVGFILLWQFAVQTGLASAAFISSPAAVGAALINLFGETDVLSHLATTAIEVIIAFAISVVLGISCAVLLDRNERLRALLSPYVSALNSMPRVALGPMFILWFGIGMASKIVLAASLGFFIVLVSTMGGLATVDRDMLLMSRLYGASDMRLFWYVRLPWALPSVFAGLKLTLIYCTSGAVIGEMIAAKSGLGLLVQTFSGQFDIASVLAVMLILIVCVVFVTTAFEWLERRLLSWAHGTTDIPG
ncbi:ABC transporter permease [Variovorax sp. J31P179]|uniref:ABC transporter permease n=1 Tax=Variovorax sp. J31P179 TaxID=3053508 RepID=UPI0025780C49|nr:ABC transporter permease [Variovorax sp. J31P179]MDM0084707.1 ABC transporter permease [Variovorax sp. J31P179]